MYSHLASCPARCREYDERKRRWIDTRRADIREVRPAAPPDPRRARVRRLGGREALALRQRARARAHSPAARGRPVHVRCESFWHSIAVNVDGNLGDAPGSRTARAASYACHVARCARSSSPVPPPPGPRRPELARPGVAVRLEPGFTGSGDPAGDGLVPEQVPNATWRKAGLVTRSRTSRCWPCAAGPVEALPQQCFRAAGGRVHGRVAWRLAPGRRAVVASYLLSLQLFMPTDYQSGECAAGRSLDQS